MNKTIEISKLPSFIKVVENEDKEQTIEIDFDELYDNHGTELLSYYSDDEIKEEIEDRRIVDNELSDATYDELIDELSTRNPSIRDIFCEDEIINEAMKSIVDCNAKDLIYQIARVEHPYCFLDKKTIKDTINDLIDFYF